MDKRPYQHLSGEGLRIKAKRAERDMADEIVRLRAHDERFRAVLDLTLALDDEIAARKR